MDWKHNKIPSNGQWIGLSLGSQKYDKEHKVATRWSHVKKQDRSQWEVEPEGHGRKVDEWKHGKVYNLITLAGYLSN